MPLRERFSLLTLLFCSQAFAQLTSVEPLSVTSITSGNVLGVFSPSKAYADTILEITPRENDTDVVDDVSHQFTIADIPASYLGVSMIRPKWSDRLTTGTDVFGFTLPTDPVTEVCIWYSDLVAPPAWIDADGYIDRGFDITLNGTPASGFCALKTGALSFDENTASADGGIPMYVVSLSPGHLQHVPLSQTAPPPDDNGFYRFTDTTGVLIEGATAFYGSASRITGSDDAVTVDVDDTGGTCTAGVEYDAVAAATQSWADGELGVGGGSAGIQIVSNAGTITEPCTILLTFASATGGISADGTNQTFTLTLIDSAIAAFPGCEGFGCETTHGRGGIVVRVTNTNDSGAGSLREALAMTEPRIIVFTVSGTITVLSRMKLGSAESFVYIAGQTAPGDGIALRGPDQNEPISMSRDLLSFVSTNIFHDGVIRHIRFRHGAVGPGQSTNDCIQLYAGTYNVVLDHNSFTWAGDETIGIWISGPNPNGSAHDITISRSIIGEGANASHNLGPLFSGGNDIGDSLYNITMHHNLGIHLSHRNYNLTTGSQGADRGIQYINNVHYNTSNHDYGFGQNQYGGDSSINADVIGDYFKTGPDRPQGSRPITISALYFADLNTDYLPDNGLPMPRVQLHAVGSTWRNQDGTPHDLNDEADNYSHVRKQYGGETWDIRAVPLVDQPQFPVTIDTFGDAYISVVINEDVGATKPKFDSVDRRLVDDPEDGGGYDINNTPGGTGTWPTLSTFDVPLDTDLDGVPDAYETSPLGTNPSVFENHAVLDHDADGLTNIEEWIESL